MAAALVARDDDLDRGRITGVGDGVAHDANGTHNLARLLDLRGKVRGIADHNTGLRGSEAFNITRTNLGNFALTLDTDNMTSLIVHKLFYGAIKHISASIDGR